MALPTHLNSVWMRDKHASDSMDPASKLMELGFLTRQAVGLIKGLKVDLDESGGTITVMCPISWFNINETYPWDKSVEQSRRDMRKGKVQALLKHDKKRNGIQFESTWGAPCAGHFVEYCFTTEEDPDTLLVENTMTVGTETVFYRQVYRRKK